MYNFFYDENPAGLFSPLAVHFFSLNMRIKEYKLCQKYMSEILSTLH